MVDEDEEAVCFGGGDEVGGYFVYAVWEVGHGDAWDGAGGVFCLLGHVG